MPSPEPTGAWGPPVEHHDEDPRLTRSPARSRGVSSVDPRDGDPHLAEPTDSAAAETMEGTDTSGSEWDDFPIDDVRVRVESRTVFETLRRIERNTFIMNPDFQRGFVWPKATQSKLIESAVMRIPLPMFYTAENDNGHMVVVDGLQRLHTFRRFVSDQLRLILPDRDALNGKRFSELPPKLQNRVEDCTLRFCIVDSSVPERARLDIFERVNGGTQLTRQQMRNCMFMGQATRFLKQEVDTDLFREATDNGLNTKAMKDRELVNRFCAFQVLGHAEYRGDMDGFLAKCLRRMNKCPEPELSALSRDLRRGLANNIRLFGKNAFRRHIPGLPKRSVINAALWDVMSTGLSRYPEDMVATSQEKLLAAIGDMLADPEFEKSITMGTNHTAHVTRRFEKARAVFEGILHVDAN